MTFQSLAHTANDLSLKYCKVMMDYEEHVCRHYRHMQSNHSNVLTKVFTQIPNTGCAISNTIQQAEAVV